MVMPQAGSRSATIRPRQRRDGTIAFDVRYRTDGRSRTLSFQDRRSSERWANLVRSIGAEEALKLVQTTDAAATITVAEWGEKFIAGLSGVEPRTLDHYRLYMRVSITPLLGALPLDAVTSARIAEWINDQAGRYAAKTVKLRHGFMSAMFQAAVDDGLLAKNPCGRSRLPRSEQREEVFLSPSEYRTLVAFIPPRWRPLVAFLAATGMRWGEATAIRPGDVDLYRGTVRVSRSWKWSKDRGWYIGVPKTNKSRRTIALPQTLLPELKPLLKAGHEYVFVNRDGGPIRQQKFWEDVWSPARRLANGMPPFDGRDARPGGPWDVTPAAEPIGKWPRIHDLRHTHVAWLMADGVDITVIQARLGHESIQTTVNTYGHLAPDVLQRPADTIDRLALLG